MLIIFSENQYRFTIFFSILKLISIFKNINIFLHFEYELFDFLENKLMYDLQLRVEC